MIDSLNQQFNGRNSEGEEELLDAEEEAWDEEEHAEEVVYGEEEEPADEDTASGVMGKYIGIMEQKLGQLDAEKKQVEEENHQLKIKLKEIAHMYDSLGKKGAGVDPAALMKIKTQLEQSLSRIKQLDEENQALREQLKTSLTQRLDAESRLAESDKNLGKIMTLQNELMKRVKETEDNNNSLKKLLLERDKLDKGPSTAEINDIRRDLEKYREKIEELASKNVNLEAENKRYQGLLLKSKDVFQENLMLKEKQLELAGEMKDLKETVKQTITEDESQMNKMKQLLELTTEELKRTKLALDMKSAEGTRLLEMLEEQRSKRLEENIATMELIKEFQKHQDLTKTPNQPHSKANEQLQLTLGAQDLKRMSSQPVKTENVIQKLPSNHSQDSDDESDDRYTNEAPTQERGSEPVRPPTGGKQALVDYGNGGLVVTRSVKKKNGVKKPKLSPDLAVKEPSRRKTLPKKKISNDATHAQKSWKQEPHHWDRPAESTGATLPSKGLTLSHLSSVESSHSHRLDRLSSARLKKSQAPAVVQSSATSLKPPPFAGRKPPARQPTASELAEQALQTLQKSKKKIAQMESEGLGSLKTQASAEVHRDLPQKTTTESKGRLRRKRSPAARGDSRAETHEWSQQQQRLQMISQMNEVLAEFEGKIKSMKGEIKDMATHPARP